MLPFDDESIPNLFKKIKSGMYSLPSHLSQLSRDLILRMLVVDPMKRITIADIRMHPWFQHKLPAYLALPPAMIERTERYVDDEIVTAVCELPLRGVSRDTVVNAVVDHNSSNPIAHDLRVTYELLLDAKRHKLRIADVVIALKDQSNTPPTATSIALSPRTLSSPANSMSSHISTSSSGRKVDLGSIPRGMYGTSSGASSISGSNPPAGPTSSSAVQPSSDSMSKKRRYIATTLIIIIFIFCHRWYLGIQSKKEPAHVMTEVHKALLALDCCWYPVTNYRVLALWNHWHSDHQVHMLYALYLLFYIYIFLKIVAIRLRVSVTKHF
jgi:5'-AMP-activated protein kinase catalytic alpha subunit